MPTEKDRSLPSTVAAVIAFISTAWMLGEVSSLELSRDLTLAVEGVVTSDAQCHRHVRWEKVHFTLSVKYQYRVGSTTYPGSRYFVADWRLDEARCRDLATRLKQGNTIPVWIDPIDPSFAVLNPARRQFMLWISVPLFLASIGYLARAAWLRVRTKRRRHATNSA